MKPFGLIGVGLFAGLMGGLLGVGGGIVTVPMLMLFFGIEAKLAIGTSLAAIVPTAIMAAARHAHLGNVDWKLAGLVATGAVVGAFIGASATNHVSGEWLRRLFAAFLIVTAIRMLWK